MTSGSVGLWARRVVVPIRVTVGGMLEKGHGGMEERTVVWDGVAGSEGVGGLEGVEVDVAGCGGLAGEKGGGVCCCGEG